MSVSGRVRQRLLPLAVVFLALAPMPSCREEAPKLPAWPAPPKKSAPKAAIDLHPRRTPLDAPHEGVDRQIEEFTGGHTRLVWTELQQQDGADTFADGEQLLLKGLDTRDGKGERMIQDRLDNYARPLLSADGESIVFSNKQIVGDKGNRSFVCHVYRTDWRSAKAKPVRLTSGYATDCWKDPATGIDWIYVARGFHGGKRPTLDADRLVRVRLDDPKVEEPVYVDGRHSPDNVQLSRDGTRASGLFPWPNCGVFHRREDGTFEAKKLTTGCWPSLAPDDSGVSWVFDGAHRGAIFFSRDGRRSWEVNFNHGAGMDGHELYHPRWSNHARFMVITGPYNAGKNPEGSMLRYGGGTAQVYIGKFSESLDRMEGWLQVTHDALSESYPDLWVAGGEKYSLPAVRESTPLAAQQHADTWPQVRDGLVFFWTDRNATNHFQGRDGKRYDSAELTTHGAARFGRHHEMLPDGGAFESGADVAGYALETLRNRPEVTVELALLAPPDVLAAGGNSRPQELFRGPGLAISLDEKLHLQIEAGAIRQRSAAPLASFPVHLAAVRTAKGAAAFLNGAPVSLQPQDPPDPQAAPDALSFGRGWLGGLLGIAIHDRALDASEVQQQARAQMARLAVLSPAPQQLRARARLVEVSAMPTVEGIAPYRAALVAYVYETEDGPGPSRLLVKHWAMLDQQTVRGFPREVGTVHDLVLEKEADHAHLRGERVVDETTAFDLEPWIDVSRPVLP